MDHSAPHDQPGGFFSSRWNIGLIVFLAIAGFYRTVDELGFDLRGRAVQAWLDGDTMLIAALE